MELLQYLSSEWVAAVEKALKGGSVGKITASANFFHTHTPFQADRYLYLSYRDGAFERLATGNGAGPDATFRLNGDYAAYADVLSGKADALRAISTGKLSLRGNLMYIMRLAPFLDVITDALSVVPTQY